MREEGAKGAARRERAVHTRRKVRVWDWEKKGKETERERRRREEAKQRRRWSLLGLRVSGFGFEEEE